MFKIKHKKIILSFLIFFVFILVNVINPNSIYFKSTEKYGTVYATPRGGFHSGSFSSSHSSSSGGFKSGSFSNSSKSSSSKSYNSSSGTKNYSSGSSWQSTKRSYIPIPIPIPFGHSSYMVEVITMEAA
ncbi:amino acid permease [Clostridium sp. DMHC 10]|uniref:amino acid permease n=1 Tax=Clostridium sp. DMHC 10 TaxID=747377 RepID=UPI000A781E8B|nr:amino acid permease [Clostridium sp. DMHC 10]